MIKEWVISNFKSIEGEKKLEFRPLTIFTGPNSSGKSTVLQSLLLVSQTLQNQMVSRSVVLNGSIKQFGSYKDVVFMREPELHIHIGFKINRDQSDSGYYYAIGDKFDTVKCGFEISSKDIEEDLQPELEQFELELFKDKTKSSYLTIKKEVKNNGDEKYHIDTDYQPPYSIWGKRKRLEYEGARFSHFLPSFLIGRYSIKEKYKVFISNLFDINDNHYNILTFNEEQDLIRVLRADSLKIVEEVYENCKRKTKPIKNLYQILQKSFSFENFESFVRIMKIQDEDCEKYQSLLLDVLKQMKDTYGTEMVSMYFHQGVEFVKDFFTGNIKYLGPLRDEPKSIYPLEGMGSIADVGLKGENTAAVFENNKDNGCDYIDPSAFEDLDKIKFEIRHDSLTTIINKWLVYLGVASDINTIDKGKFGHELKITTDVEQLQQDLTHVGVGVSQILPILVLCLLAKKGSVIVLEQPELHLHPKVQTRLADFFVSLNELGKQCVVETHSEYLINRLRYIVAKSRGSKVAKNTLIYFVEKEQGHSNYRPIKINKYGVIEEWPKGFFDESEEIAAAVIQAGIEKRKKELQSRKNK